MQAGSFFLKKLPSLAKKSTKAVRSTEQLHTGAPWGAAALLSLDSERCL